MTATHAKVQVAEIIAQLERVELTAHDPDVDRLLMAYRTKFRLGPRDAATERAQKWVGAKYEGHIVAVAGERRDGMTLEVTDAYYDGTQVGKVAFASFAYGYRQMLELGVIDRIVHAALYENTDHWEAIIRETGDTPKVLVFIHERKAAAT